MHLTETIPDLTLWAALDRRIDQHGASAVLTSEGRDWSALELRDAAESLAGKLAALGVGEQSRVLVALPNVADYVALILALARLRAVWVAVSPRQRGPVLEHMVRTVDPDLVIATGDAAYEMTKLNGLRALLVALRPERSDLDGQLGDRISPLQPCRATDCDVRAIMFTSGTTGPPKAVQVTEHMLIASAWGAAHASDATEGDRFLLWEPLYHIGGAQMLALALLLPVHLVLTPKFSASRFWSQNRAHGITKLHYLGGVLEILLKQAPTREDRDHKIVLGFGAGARPEISRAFQSRFGVTLREVYGLTEASSFTTINRNGPLGSIGSPLPWMDIAVCDDEGGEVAVGDTGEIVIRPKSRELLTPGYLGDCPATKRLIQDGRLHTGDLARRDETGAIFFVGRKREAIRRRGELISAWEIETALMTHPDIAECAAVGVPAEIGEEEILVYIRPAEGVSADLTELAVWARGTMHAKSCPRYWRSVSEFPRTPSERIAKAKLPRDPNGSLDICNLS
ncbi:MAG: AMP-binding protein [Pseudomonadota bacterium]